MQEPIIDNKYQIIQQLNAGSFGMIYKCKNIRTGEYNAIKIEEKSAQHQTLRNEAKIYQYLGKQDGFLRLKWYGVDKKNTYIVFDLLDVSLAKIIKEHGKLNNNSVAAIGLQMLKRIKLLHEKEMLHRDIKPENFMIGRGDNSNKIYLIDLSFCKRYMQNNKHIEEKAINNIIGTVNYVSVNVHNRIEPSRRDDLESFAYILIFLIEGKLPWENNSIGDIYMLKNRITEMQYIPFYIRKILMYVRSLEFKDDPDYIYIQEILKRSIYE